MTEQELKHLSRRDLMEIIAAMKKKEIKLQELLAIADEKLTDRNIRVDNAGSIAEAAMALNGVFEAAQAAADTYLRSLHFTNADIEERRNRAEAESRQIVEEARQEAQAMVRKANEQSAAMLAAAEAEIAKKWDVFHENVQKVLQSHSELATYLGTVEDK